MDISRPKIHFTPPSGWMNDPNGLVYLDGEYHLFYQHNPLGIDWGHVSWGHAVSQDLIHWQHLPVAIPVTDGVMAFSGSAVVDSQNTSGFGDGRRPPLVAIFTGFDVETKIQDQRVAFSLDNGRSWQQYANNPIIDLHETDFRDPKVFWHGESEQWIMVVALPVKHVIQIYGSFDLKHWQHLSDFSLPETGSGVWECPDLFSLPLANGRRKWVLIVSIGSGTIGGGSSVKYLLGDFDGRKYGPDFRTLRYLDFGPDFYAFASWNAIEASDGRRIGLAWMSNLQYAAQIPAGDWRGQQSFPREIRLLEGDNGGYLSQHPVSELKSLRAVRKLVSEQLISEQTPLEVALPPMAVELAARIRPENADDVYIEFSDSSLKKLIIRYDTERETLCLDRTQAGLVDFHPGLAGVYETPLVARDGVFDLSILLDSCSVEIFGNDGCVTLSSLFFFDSSQISLSVSTPGGDAMIQSLDVWSISLT